MLRERIWLCERGLKYRCVVEMVFPETSFNLGLFLAGRITTKTTAAGSSDPKNENQQEGTSTVVRTVADVRTCMLRERGGVVREGLWMSLHSENHFLKTHTN